MQEEFYNYFLLQNLINRFFFIAYNMKAGTILIVMYVIINITI
ncbi:hypothetical protein V438_05200 [Clostridioides difficile]|nr:hypothetical protein V439_10465 [Clostridioides difficile]PCN58275.1 hypothetical protein V438_05200 [Clostridioides difficile]GCA59248.1 hypothetical protein TNHP173_08940 [Clostridioides difficile]GMK62977.1 hypothetical protein JSCD1_28700 [Clostridioides difficile]GMK66674.1 hypothetical protein JSCD2_30250 [Clostridioides difficile]